MSTGILVYRGMLNEHFAMRICDDLSLELRQVRVLVREKCKTDGYTTDVQLMTTLMTSLSHNDDRN